MQILLKMNPGLEMWFGEQVWIDEDWEEWEDDEDWPDDGWSFSFLVGGIWSPNFLVAIA
ncbi:hypothetical protein KNU71_gp057 [Streptomyces phage Braelyn]|uniref:Uncharacterized protein n=1 Tax=Streptomyces phage Braelyn TaxID=2593356 RepID=A0A514U2B0_9CAUD|nr:hypothetical protein KNU71_gp057 [Streptomyces phage Braelyn]QDK03059.1 hypothetical protein SEA_BRAELYN_245 [Streptomyces phage Braelyn]UGL63206.1 hypothetical protein SEA_BARTHOLOMUNE_249 [Streptomyces phage Bartholomune]